MQTIGLLGGMSWESSAVYYRLINEDVRRRLGGLHSAKIILWSAEFHTIAERQVDGDWAALRRILSEGARYTERAGADMLLICSNTMHKVADEVADTVSIPLLHIADITAAAIRRAESRKPLLLGTRFTMDEPFYRERLRERHGIDVARPDTDEERAIHNIIYRQLCQGIIDAESKRRCLDIVTAARKRGADSIILGCTELDLLLSQEDFDIPLFDTTELHATAAVDFALANTPLTMTDARIQ